MLIQHAPPRLRPFGGPVLRIRRSHRLAAELRGFWLFGGDLGLGRDLVTGAAVVDGSAPGLSTLPEGPVLDVSGTAFAQAAHDPDHNVLGDITVAWRGLLRNVSSFGYLLGKIPAGGGGGADTPFSLEFANPSAGKVAFVRSNSSGALPYRVWQSGGVLLTADAISTLSVSQVADIQNAPSFYANGILDGSAATSEYGGAGTGPPAGNTDPVRFGRRVDGFSQQDGLSAWAALAARVWNASEHAELEADAYGLIEEAPRYHFLASDAAPVALTGDPITTGAPVLGTPALGQIFALAGDPIAAGAPVLGTPALGQVFALTGDPITVGPPVLGSPQLNAAPSTSRTVHLPARDRLASLPARNRAVDLPPRRRTVTLQPERS